MADYPTSPAPEHLDFIFEEQEFKTDIFEAANGSEQRNQKWATPKRIWRLHYDMQAANTIWALHTTYNGAADTFTFSPEDFDSTTYAGETDITCRFEDKWARTVKYKGKHFLEVKIVEVK